MTTEYNPNILERFSHVLEIKTANKTESTGERKQEVFLLVLWTECTNVSNLIGLLSKAYKQDVVAFASSRAVYYYYYYYLNNDYHCTCSYLSKYWLMKQNAKEYLDSFFKDVRTTLNGHNSASCGHFARISKPRKTNMWPVGLGMRKTPGLGKYSVT